LNVLALKADEMATKKGKLVLNSRLGPIILVTTRRLTTAARLNLLEAKRRGLSKLSGLLSGRLF